METPEPRYTPDGAWYWTGRRWILAEEIFRPARLESGATAGSSTSREAREAATWRPRLTRLAVGAALVAALTVLVTFAAPASVRAATAALGPPAARQLFLAPFAAGLRDAHVRITTHDASSADVHSDGAMTFTPSRALRLEVRTDGDPVPVLQTVDVDGISYSKTRDLSQSQISRLVDTWTVSNTSSQAFAGTGWAQPDPPAHLRIRGLESVGSDLAWHLTDGDGSSWWVRTRDGYPLKIVRAAGAVTVTYRFDRFNAAGGVQSPLDGRVSTRLVSGRAGDTLESQAARVQVVRTEVLGPAAGLPGFASHTVAALVVFKNTSGRVVAFPDAPAATDASGRDFGGVPDGPMRTAGAPTMFGPGESAATWLRFRVPSDTSGLTVRIQVTSSAADVQDCLFSIKLID